jgi:hypothetical protein
MLFDDDPGIMSEVETSSTGFRRGGKQRSSLPVVRTPSKTLERPLGKTSGAGVSMGVGPMARISPHPSAMATHHHQMVHLVSHHHGLSNNKHSSAAASGGRGTSLLPSSSWLALFVLVLPELLLPDTVRDRLADVVFFPFYVHG